MMVTHKEREQAKSNEASVQLLVWEIAGERFACLTQECREVDTQVRVVPVPHSKPYLAGVNTVRGEVVTVVRLLTMMGRKDQADRSASYGSIIRFRSDAADVGVLADRVLDIISVETDTIEKVPAHFSETERKFLTGVVTTPLGLVNIINVKALF